MNKCEICRANNICDHYSFGFETCGNYIPTNEWISVEDGKPRKVGDYLTIDDEGHQQVFKFFDGYFHVKMNDYWFCNLSVTHWMPLPKPPKGE